MSLVRDKITHLLAGISLEGFNGLREMPLLKLVFEDVLLKNGEAAVAPEVKRLFAPLPNVTRKKCSKTVKRKFTSAFERVAIHINCFTELYVEIKEAVEPECLKKRERVRTYLQFSEKKFGSVMECLMDDSCSVPAMPAFVVAACIHIALLQSIIVLYPLDSSVIQRLMDKIQYYRDHLTTMFMRCMTEREVAVSKFQCSMCWVDTFMEENCEVEVEMAETEARDRRKSYVSKVIRELYQELPFDYHAVVHAWEDVQSDLIPLIESALAALQGDSDGSSQ